MEVFVWLAKVLRSGNFRRVAKPLYYRLDHPHSFTNEYFRTSTSRRRAVWTTLFTGLLEAALPLCHSPEARLFVQQTIVDRVFDNLTRDDPNSSENLAAECLERLKYEQNTHLVSAAEFAQILRALPRRLRELKLNERSTMRRTIYRNHRAYQLGRVIYPASTMWRAIYQINHGLPRSRMK
jgi:hypothetical protein